MERSTIVQTSSDDEFTSTAMTRQDMVLKSSRLKKLKSQSSVSSQDVKVRSTKRQPILSDDSDMDAFEAENVERESKDVDKQSTISISSSSSVISISSASSSSSSSVSSLDLDRSASPSSSSSPTRSASPDSSTRSTSTSSSHSTSSAETSSSTSSLFEQEGNESPVLVSPQRRRSHAVIPELPLQRRTSSADDGSLILTVKRSKKRQPSFPAAPPMDENVEEAKKPLDGAVARESLLSKPDQWESTKQEKAGHLRLSQSFNPNSMESSKSKLNESSNSKPIDSPSKTKLIDYPSKTKPVDYPSKTKLVDSLSKTKPVDPPSKSKPVDPPSKTKPVDPPSKSKPVDPPSKSKPIDPPSKSKPIDPPLSSKPTASTPPKPPRQSKPSKFPKPSKSWKYTALPTSQLLPPRPTDSLVIVDLYSYTPPYDQLAIRPASKQQLRQWIEAPVAPSLCILHGPPGSGKVETFSAVNSSDLCFAVSPRKSTCFSVSPM